MDKTKQERYNKGLERDLMRLSTAQRCIIERMMGTIQTLDGQPKQDLTEAVALLSKATARDRYKRDHDKTHDFERRTLVGARIKRADADYYRRIAQATGRSLYRFVSDALREEAVRSCDVEWEPLVPSILAPSSPPGPSGGPQGDTPSPAA